MHREEHDKGRECSKDKRGFNVRLRELGEMRRGVEEVN